MRTPGLGEILLILVLCAVVFGASKVNWMGDVLGGFVRNLKRGMRNDPRIEVKPPPPTDDPRIAVKPVEPPSRPA
jgi:Sec-independent protein translocase protein TatA